MTSAPDIDSPSMTSPEEEEAPQMSALTQADADADFDDDTTKEMEATGQNDGSIATDDDNVDVDIDIGVSDDNNDTFNQWYVPSAIFYPDKSLSVLLIPVLDGFYQPTIKLLCKVHLL